MKHSLFFFILLAILFGACEQPVDDAPASRKPSFTIKNESSYDLSDVTWSGASFASPDSSGLLKGTESTREVSEDASGYIYFTRKGSGIKLRTQEIFVREQSPRTIGDNTVVLEVANETNRATLAIIDFMPNIALEYKGRVVAKNDTVAAGESTVNTVKAVQFTLKNSGTGALLLTGNEPVKSSDPSFAIVQTSASEIAPGASLDFTVNFNPSAETDYVITVTIRSNDPSGDFVFSITANGLEAKPALSLFTTYNDAPVEQGDRIDFGSLGLGNSKTETLTIKNTGKVNFEFSGNPPVQSSNAGVFVISAQPSVTALAPGESAQFNIQYAPGAAGTASADITIAGNIQGGSFAFTVRGTAVDLSPPSSISQTAAAADSITLAWSSVPDAGQYYIYRSDSADGTYLKIDSTPAVLYTDADLSANRAYYYKVAAHNDSAGEGKPSDYISAKTSAALLSVPVVVVTAQSIDSIKVEWNAVPGAHSYKIYRAVSADGDYLHIETCPSSSSSYTDTDLAAGKSYWYKVSVVNSDTTEGDKSAGKTARTLTEFLPPPEGISVEVQSHTGIRISWDPVIGAAAYKVYQDTNEYGPYTTLISTVTDTFLVVSGLQPLTTYYYKVVSVNADGESEKSDTVSAKTNPTPIPATPTGLVVTGHVLTRMQYYGSGSRRTTTCTTSVSWQPVELAESYIVYYSSSETGRFTAKTVSGLSTTITTSTQITYYIKVSAVDSSGESPPTELKHVTNWTSSFISSGNPLAR
jgi:fibronectin type 3 domain-containing protein